MRLIRCSGCWVKQTWAVSHRGSQGRTLGRFGNLRWVISRLVLQGRRWLGFGRVFDLIASDWWAHRGRHIKMDLDGCMRQVPGPGALGRPRGIG